MASKSLRNKVTVQRVEATLEKLTRDHLINNSNAIVRMDETVHAFGRYTIQKTDNGYDVYRGATLAAVVKTSRVAISWCIADKYGKNTLARDLLNLDLEIDRKEAEITHYRHTLSRSNDSVKRMIVSDRLIQSTDRMKQAKELLDKCLNSAKYWQLKGFNDETARFGIKNTVTTKC